ncbi:hypothetical protein E5676_scaffold208G00480 [Cucumis melo var. makuwa]|uniref:Uncharacterized protein n=1 Tax=Cucumis melo var. makuwa TaxID=1194695 RepID=A0A5D3E2M6_CUCMM|nr:hypothetical protein E5676_scaffold208G00480 [Cucumis melo var. makuwa]
MEDTRSAEDGRSAEVRPTVAEEKSNVGDDKSGRKNIGPKDKLGARKSDVEEENRGGRIETEESRTSKKAINLGRR